MLPVRSTKLTFWLALTALVTPFVWIRIGPQGIAFYGPDVPDIYILGATILGKDRSFPGITIAIVFQLVMGLCFILFSHLAVLRARKGAGVRGLATVQMMLLLLFPCWLGLYVNGVIHNSDGAAADLRVYPHVGLLVYILLVALTLNTFVTSAKGRAYPSGSVGVQGLALIQLALLLLLPLWICPMMERGADHNETVAGLTLYWWIGLAAYILLLTLTIKALVKGTKQSANSAGNT